MAGQSGQPQEALTKQSGRRGGASRPHGEAGASAFLVGIDHEEGKTSTEIEIGSESATEASASDCHESRRAHRELGHEENGEETSSESEIGSEGSGMDCESHCDTDVGYGCGCVIVIAFQGRGQTDADHSIPLGQVHPEGKSVPVHQIHEKGVGGHQEDHQKTIHQVGHSAAKTLGRASSRRERLGHL